MEKKDDVLKNACNSLFQRSSNFIWTSSLVHQGSVSDKETQATLSFADSHNIFDSTAQAVMGQP